MAAASNGHEEVVRDLLTAGADSGSQGNSGRVDGPDVGSCQWSRGAVANATRGSSNYVQPSRRAQGCALVQESVSQINFDSHVSAAKEKVRRDAGAAGSGRRPAGGGPRAATSTGGSGAAELARVVACCAPRGCVLALAWPGLLPTQYKLGNNMSARYSSQALLSRLRR
jgi:hypothetical protein